MWLWVRGVQSPKYIKPNTPFFISFHGLWLTLLFWKRVTIGFKIFKKGESTPLLYESRSFIPRWFWGTTEQIWSPAIYIDKKTTFILEIGRINGINYR